MGKNSVKIEGIEKLMRKFSQFSDEIKVEVQKELIATTLIEVETPAKESLTEKGHVDTGRLRSSVYTKYKGNESKNYSDDEGNGFTCNLNIPVKDLRVSCGTDVPYGMKIERLDSYLINNFNSAKPKYYKNINKVINKLTNKFS